MTVTITDTQMTSDVTPHIAILTTGPYVMPNRWQVSWWPGRLLDRDQASTAMKIAEAVADPDPHGPSHSDLIETLAKELGLAGEQAVELVLAPLDEIDPGAVATPTEVAEFELVSAGLAAAAEAIKELPTPGPYAYVADEPLLSVAEMERAINDPTDPYYLTDAEACLAVGSDPERARRVLTRMVIDQPDTVATQICEAMKARAGDFARAELHDAVADGPSEPDLAELIGSWRRAAAAIKDEDPEEAQALASCANALAMAVDGYRLVSNIALVLDRPTEDATKALESAFYDFTVEKDIAATENEDGGHDVTIHRDCPHGATWADELSPDQADTYAAHIALAAAEARANALADAEQPLDGGGSGA